MAHVAPLRLGAVVPQTEMAGDADAIRSFVSGVEALGVDHLVAYDHVLGAVRTGRSTSLGGVYDERDPFHDPLVLFAYLAGRHSGLEFFTGILVLPQRQTALVARQAADLAILSGGRLRLGVGAGWNPVEFEALGEDFATRGARLDEQISVLRQLWREPVVDLRTAFHSIDRAGSAPRPPHPPSIWIGGFGDRALRRAALLGDGFVFVSYKAGELLVDQWHRLHELLERAGRSPQGFGGELLVDGSDARRAAKELLDWAAMGGTHGSVITMRCHAPTVDAHIEIVRDVLEAVRAG